MPNEHHLKVEKTARYFTVGEPGPQVDDVWFACHGYGQLASDFAKDLECIESPHRLVVVPEALSRFYIPVASGFHGPDAKVGATWMTRIDREPEIADYVNYLDALYFDILRRVEPSKPRITILGFSQGGATANRWLMRGSATTDRLIMWGSLLAGDVNLPAAAKLFQTVDLTIVHGKRDKFADRKVISDFQMTLEQNAIRYNLVTFEGGHRLDRDTLKKLVEAHL